MKFLDWYLKETFDNENFEHSRLRSILSLLSDCPGYCSRKSYIKYLILKGFAEYTEAFKEAWDKYWEVFVGTEVENQEIDIPEHLRDVLST